MAVAPLQISQPQAFSGGIDFSPLAQLGQVYQRAQAENAVKDALGNGFDANNPQSLAQLATRVLPYNSTLGLSLSQLASTAANTQYQHGRDAINDAFRQQEAERSQRNADRSYAIQAQTAERTNQTPEETAVERAKAARANGIDPTTPQGKAYILTGKLPEQDTSFSTAVEQRKTAAAANGLDPASPGYQSFVLTGKMPREDAQPLTATDKKAILEADEKVQSGQQVIDNLNKAKTLSKQAFSGPMASGLGYAASFLGQSSDIGKGGVATTDLNNLVTSNALQQLKTIFGGNPTEGERAILLDIQGSANQPDAVRQKIYDRAIEAANKRLQFEKQRADELRGGSFYKQKTGQTAPQSQGSGADQMIQYARDAIAKGAPRDAVIERLRQGGVDPSGL